MKQTFENLSKKGTIITVQSATKDGGKTNNPEGWWAPRVRGQKNEIPYRTFKKIIKECKYKVIDGGFKKGELLGNVTRIKIL